MGVGVVRGRERRSSFDGAMDLVGKLPHSRRAAALRPHHTRTAATAAPFLAADDAATVRRQRRGRAQRTARRHAVRGTAAAAAAATAAAAASAATAAAVAARNARDARPVGPKQCVDPQAQPGRRAAGRVVLEDPPVVPHHPPLGQHKAQ